MHKTNGISIVENGESDGIEDECVNVTQENESERVKVEEEEVEEEEEEEEEVEKKYRCCEKKFLLLLRIKDVILS